MNFRFLLTFLLLFSAFSCSVSDTNTTEEGDDLTIYIDSQEDFDTNRFKKMNPGTKILFARGAIFNGEFAPLGSGTEENPILIAAYDPDTKAILQDPIDDKPIINGRGIVGAALRIYNSSFIEINNLELTNTNGTDDDQGELRGIHIIAENSGLVQHVVVKNLYVHDVNGKVAGKQRGGIHFNVYGDETPTRFHHVRIEDNWVQNVGGVGIANQSSWGSIDTDTYNPWTDLVIRGNRIERTGRNALIVRYSTDPIVEYNVLAYSSLYSSGHSVFNFNTVGCVMQFNEAYGNTGPADEHDHGGFDADWNARNTIIQYNYSHDNNWFAGIMRRYNDGVKIRYNISQNELLGAYFYGFPTDTGVKDVEVYNNTHYFKEGIDAKVFVQAGKNRVPIETTFKNNIFYFSNPGEWGNEPSAEVTFHNNLFFNLTPKGEGYLTDDPLFVNPGIGGTDIDMKATDRLAGYRLQSTSPAIDAGLIIEENGSKDFWGNSLYRLAPDIGAHEFHP